MRWKTGTFCDVIPNDVRFWKYIKKTPICWIWTGAVNNGYGYFTLTDPRRNMLAHRFSYELHVGPIPDGMMVCHECDNPACVRPDHLFLGTSQDNTDDMISKGRQKPVRGEKSWNARLSESDIQAIRRRLASGESQVSIAGDYNVHQTHISQINLGKAWKHVKGTT